MKKRLCEVLFGYCLASHIFELMFMALIPGTWRDKSRWGAGGYLRW